MEHITIGFQLTVFTFTLPLLLCALSLSLTLSLSCMGTFVIKEIQDTERELGRNVYTLLNQICDNAV